MRLFCIILILLFSTEVSQSKNVLDFLEQKLDAKTEQRVLEKFKKTDCYKKGMNYKIQPHYNYLVQPFYVLQLKKIDKNILTNKSLFLKKLCKWKKTLYGYTIFNDSLQNVAFAHAKEDYFYCNYMKGENNTVDNIFQYAMENQYLLFFVDGFPGNIYFAYKDGSLIVLESQFWSDGNLKICPFEEFDWEQPYLLIEMLDIHSPIERIPLM